MESVYITSHSFSASGDGRPVESLTLSCAKITETYTEQDNKGEKKSTSIMEYDFQKHKGE
jgi:type VI protein secretion system component Hcp